MFVTYAAEGQEPQVWDVDLGRVRVNEAAQIQKLYGNTWEAFRAACMSGDIIAHRLLLWHLLRQTHHTLRLEDVPDFYLDELKVQRSKAELSAMRDQVARANMPDADRQQMLMGLDMEIEAAPGELGKAS